MSKNNKKAERQELDAQSFEDRLEELLASEQGRLKLKEIEKCSEAVRDMFKRARQVDARILRKPMTV